MREALERLMHEARLLGDARMLTDDQPVTQGIILAVTSRVQEYLKRSKKSYADAAKAMGVAQSTFSQVMNCTYEGDLEKHIRDLDKWLETELLRETAPKPGGFVMTSVAEKVYAVAKYVLRTGEIGLVYGPAGIGKTMTLQAIRSEFSNSIYVSLKSGAETPLAVVEAIGIALRITNLKMSVRVWIQQLEKVLRGSNRLILIDQAHKLTTSRQDKSILTLTDLYDATGCPMLWAGTTDLWKYISEGKGQGREPMDQVASRVGFYCDLAEKTVARGGGKPLVTTDDIRRVFNQQKVRLASDAVEYLRRLANTTASGALRLCHKLVQTALVIYGDEKPLTAAMLDEVHVQRVGSDAAQQHVTEMESMTFAKVG